MGWTERHGRLWRGRHRWGGVVHTTEHSYHTKTAAKHALAKMITELESGGFHDPRAGHIRLDDWVLKTWAPAREVKKSTSNSDNSRLDVLVLPRVTVPTWTRRQNSSVHLGGMWLSDIANPIVEDWVAAITPLRAPKTVRSAHALLYSAMDAAVRAGKVRANPCADTRNLPDDDGKPITILRDEELTALVTATDPHWRALTMFLAGTGVRLGEATGLLVGDVDLELDLIRIVRDLGEVGGELEEDTVKTKSSRRTLPMTPPVRRLLRPLVEGRMTTEAVFVTPRGARVRRSNHHQRVWRPALEASGIDRPVRRHDLRHLFASRLITGGVPLSVVSRLLGHASIQTTHNIYFHLAPTPDDRIDQILADMFEDSMGLLVP